MFSLFFLQDARLLDAHGIVLYLSDLELFEIRKDTISSVDTFLLPTNKSMGIDSLLFIIHETWQLEIARLIGDSCKVVAAPDVPQTFVIDHHLMVRSSGWVGNVDTTRNWLNDSRGARSKRLAHVPPRAFVVDPHQLDRYFRPVDYLQRGVV